MILHNKTRILTLILALTLVAGTALALPPLPTEFYGAIYTENEPAPPGGTITLRLPNGTQCGESFEIQEEGRFGLITCPGDDPETPGVEGLPQGEQLAIYYNGEPTAYLDGTNTTSAGEFQFLNVSHPLPFCGDDICDLFFEDHNACPADCLSPNATGNATGNGTGGNGTGGGETGGGSSSGGSSDAGGGGGGGGGGAGLIPQTEVPFSQGLPVGAEFECRESWVCEEWGRCTIDGIRERECEDLNSCGSNENKPATVQECDYIPSCFNGVQDFEETGVDCGGPCGPCATCTNDVQDCHTLENGTIICETGVDCGGVCRECDSCFNGVQDHGEDGVDCGGPYCEACSTKPILEFPNLVCERSPNPLTNGGGLFFLILLFLIGARTYFYLQTIERLKRRDAEDDYKRARDYFAERRKLVMFITIALLIALLAYLYYYEFLLCDLEMGYLWWFIIPLLVAPMIVYKLWGFMEYHDKEKLRALGAVSHEHAEAMNRMLEVENRQILELEGEIKGVIEQVAADKQLLEQLERFSELKTIYKDIVRLYYEYRSNKSPYGIEQDLCEKVYAVESNEHFKELASKHPQFWVLYDRLKLLYQHYESKQKIYDEIEKEHERIKQRAQGEPQRSSDASDDDAGESGSEQKS